MSYSRQIFLITNHSCIHTQVWTFYSNPNTPETYQILSKKTYQDDWLSPSKQEGERAFGRNSILQALHQTFRSPPRIVQRFLISKNKGSLARSKDSSKKVFSIGWVCMIHCLTLRKFLTRTVRLKSSPGMNGIRWRIVRHFQGYRNMYMVSLCVWRVANVARL